MPAVAKPSYPSWNNRKTICLTPKAHAAFMNMKRIFEEKRGRPYGNNDVIIAAEQIVSWEAEKDKQ